MQRLTSLVLRHRLLVALIWIALTVVGGLCVSKATSGMNHHESTPGLAGYDANQAMLRQLGLDGDQAPTIVTLQLPAGDSMHSAAGRAAAAAAFTRVASTTHVGLADYATSHDPKLISADGRSTWALYDMPNPDTGSYTNAQAALQAALKQATPAGGRMVATGDEQLQTLSAGGHGLSTLDETLIGAAAALVVLAFVYGSAVAVLPLLMALPSILVTFLLIYGLEQLTPISALVQYLVAFVGLGIAIDYSLLVVTRWREERERGLAHEDAIIAASNHAGRAVVLSGLTVAAGMLSLLIIPVQFLQSIGLGSMMIPLAALAASVTLLPVTLSAWGPALDRHRLRGGSTTYSRGWERWAGLIIKRRWLAGSVGLVIMIALAIPALSLTTGQPSANALGGHGEAEQAFHKLEAGGIPDAVSFPIQILVHGDSANANRVAAIAAHTTGVWTVLTPRLSTPHDNNARLVSVIPDQSGITTAGTNTVTRLRNELAGKPGAPQVGGDTAANMDFTSAIYHRFPLMLAIIAIITFLLLARSFRSVALALKAVLLNLISLGASFGFLVLFWQQGHGSSAVFGVPATGSVKNWVPIIMFAFLFGISMDYEVFVLARMREIYDATGDTREAIVGGIARTGRLITCAALILAISFASLSTVNDIAVKVPAAGLAFGVIVDAVIVRTLLIPAMAAMLGKWNWWMPDPLARALRIRAGSSLIPASDGGS